MPEKQALIVRGGWSGHMPHETTDEFLPFLDAQGYAVRIEEDAAIYADPAVMAGIDVIVQCVSLMETSREAIAGLRGAVAAGTGLVGWHGGIVDSYRSHAEYLQLVGGQFAHHPASVPPDQRRGDGTDNFIEHAVSIAADRSDHPIVAGVQDFTLTTEQYWVLTDSANDVLATISIAARSFDAWHESVTVPAVWTRRWGDGRITVVTPGHRLEDIRHPAVKQLIERGIQWSTR